MACVISLGATAQISKKHLRNGIRTKYSMFIHFGLYSELGGVCKGNPVTRRIQWTNPPFAESSVTGMEILPCVSIPTCCSMQTLLCHWPANSMPPSSLPPSITTVSVCSVQPPPTIIHTMPPPGKRDSVIKEMGKLCKRGGIQLHIYFTDRLGISTSLSHPSHNCDFINSTTPWIHQAQATELLTNHGPISELWFDMGSNTPAKNCINWCNRLQPDCTVSGRLGNDQYDFSVMADNTYPEGSFADCMANSSFHVRWNLSYRSWQKRGTFTKAMENYAAWSM